MRRGRLVVAGAAVLPVFYVAVYLAAFWNPLAHLDRLPVALVVQDAGARTASGPLDAGAALASTLERQRTFAWHLAAAGPAAAGLKSGRWDAELVIPTAFSAEVASATSAHPRPATLDVRVDAADNYLASRFAGTVFSAIRSAAEAQFTSHILASILVHVSAARSGAARAGVGARRLAAGARRADVAAGQLSAGLDRAESGAGALRSGLAALQAGLAHLDAGAAQLSAGVGRLAAAVVPLPAGTAALARGAGLVATGTRLSAAGGQRAAAGAGRLAQGAAQVLQALRLYETTNPEARLDPVYQQALAGQERVVAGLDELARALTAAEPGTQRLAAGAGQVAAGAAALAAAAGRLASGVGALRTGTDRLSAGATQLLAGGRAAGAGEVALVGGLAALSSGASGLTAGEGRIAAGARQLATGLSGAGAPVPRASAITDAVRLASQDVHPVRAPAAGFAPYAAALALWVGIVVADLVLRGRAGAADQRAMAALVGAQALGVAVVTASLARVSAGRGLAVLGFALLAAATLAALLSLLRGAFGAAGLAVAVALLVLQLTSTAWVYPIQTAPRLARLLHPLLPTTYLVRGLRAILAGANGVGPDVTVLAGVLAVAVVGTGVLSGLRPRPQG